MRGSVLECADLLAITGYQKPGDAARSLRAQGIKVFDGKAGIWTTLELVNAAGGIVAVPNDREAFRPDELL